MGLIDTIQMAFVDWWAWTTTIFSTLSRAWLVAMVVFSMIVGFLVARSVAAGFVLWEVGIMLVIAAGTGLILIAGTQIDPTFFSPEALARSQVPQ